MIRTSLQVRLRNISADENLYRTYVNINPNYIKQVGSDANPAESVTGQTLPGNYETFWQWCNAVGAAIGSLSSATYTDARVTAEWMMSGEVE